MLKKCSVIVLCFLVLSNLAPALAMGQKPKDEPVPGLDSVLGSGKPVVVKLGADWCPPCRAMKPIIKELAKEQAGKVIFLDLDIEQQRDLARRFKISLIPTIIFYDKNGKFKAKKTGFMSKRELLEKIKELDLYK